MKLSSSTYFVLLLWPAIVHCSALDWHLPLIGYPIASPVHSFAHVANSPNSPPQAVILTVTDRNILAVLNATTGAIVWRHQEPEGSSPLQYKLCSSSRVIVYSEGRSFRGLSAGSGEIMWSVDIVAPGSRSHFRGTAAECLPAEGALLVRDGHVSRVNTSNGDVDWTSYMTDSPIDETRGTLLDISVSDDECGIMLKEELASGVSFQQVKIGLTTGSFDYRGPTVVLPPIVGEHAALFTSANPAVVWLEAGLLQGVTLDSSTSLKRSFASDSFVKLHTFGRGANGTLVAERQDGTAVVLRYTKVGFLPVAEFRDPSINPVYSLFVDRSRAGHIGRLSLSIPLKLASLQVISLQTGYVRGQTYPMDFEFLGALRAFVFQPQAIPDSNNTPKLFLATTSGAVQLWEDSTMAWVREEGLGSIDLDPLFIQVPFSRSASLETDQRRSNLKFTSRIRTQLHKLDASLLQAHSVKVATDYDYVILASSRAGKIFSLSIAGGGKQSWDFFVPASFRVGFKWISLSLSSLQDVDNKPLLYARATSLRGKHVFMIDPVTGHLLKYEEDTSGDMHQSTPHESNLPSLTRISHDANQISGRSSITDTPLWTYQFSYGEKLLDSVAQDINQVASSGRILGNRTALDKYLNPHLLALITSNRLTHSTSISLIDSYSGLSVFSSIIEDLVDRRGFCLILRDNWLIYSYNPSSDSRTTIVTSIELYHQLGGGNPDRYSSLAASSAAALSLSRSFTSPDGFSLAGLSRTAAGITSYSALFTTPSGQLLSIPRRLLDPRRTHQKGSKEDAEEMLLPYETVLGLDDRWIISEDYRLLEVKRVVTAPGRSESESLILAFGLDLFCTRISPSQSFDLLSPSFNRLQLYVTISILAGTLFVVRRVVAGRQTRKKWYSQGT